MRDAIIVIALFSFAPVISFGQDILINPQNQKYLFTAGTDETQAFLYNPAYLGLYDRGGALDGYYFYPSKDMFSYPNGSFHDIEIFGQVGKLGLSYRNAESSGTTFGVPLSFGDNLNQYSVGLGVGDHEIALGASMSLMSITGFGTRWFPSVGLIFRNRYFSLGAAYHNFSDDPFDGHYIERTANFGVGIRPMGTTFLTLNADLITHAGNPMSDNPEFKVGITTELVPGLEIYGIYDWSGYASPRYFDGPTGLIPSPNYLWKNSFSIGISFNFSSHIHIEGASSYQSGGYAATYGRIMVTSQEMPTILYDHRIAEIVIKGNIPDAREKGFLFFKPPKNLLNYVEEIKKCGDDPSIDALILKIYPFSTSESFFALSSLTQELVDAVEYVRSKGKKVFSYLMDDSGANEVYLATAADKVYMAPVAFIAGYGVDMDLIRLKGLFDKLHISWNARIAGQYKSTFHTIYTDSASPEQAKLIQGLVDDIYLQMIKQIEVNRQITANGSLQEELAGMVTSSKAAALHIIDKVDYYDNFKKDVNSDVFEKKGIVATVNPSSLHRYETRWGTRPEIAVIGVYGNIVTGESAPPSPFPIPLLGSDRASGSESVVAQLRTATEDNNIKAIVLRVNSGGGSALASDEIYNAIKEASMKKPIIASFGNVAASGGYYVAAGVSRIFAEPATLTGSIGVVISIPVLTDFVEKDLGGNVEEYKSGQNSSLLSPFHRWNESDLKSVDEFLNETYNDFKSKVAAGRKMTMDRVEELAQGKVYTGMQAKNLNLIDEYGGLDKAIQYSAGTAGISGDYRVKMFSVPGIGFPNLLGIEALILRSISN